MHLLNLKRLSSGCNFRAVSAVVHKEEAIGDTFISGMISNEIRQRLFENQDLTLGLIFKKTQILELAQRNAQLFNSEYLQQTLANCSEASTAPDSIDNDLESSSQMQNNDYTASATEIAHFAAISFTLAEYVLHEMLFVIIV